jgi:two-component system, cell cycle sensor histidine kinase and response regulator CckA
MDPVAAVVCDEHDVVLSLSEAARALFDVDAKGAIGKSLSELCSMDGSAIARTALVGELSDPQLAVVRTPRSAVRTVLVRAMTLPEAGGAQSCLYLFAPAVAPAAEPEPWTNKVAIVATRIAHDFNKFLTPVLGHAGLLEQELAAGDPLSRRAIAIREASEAARAFANRLMALDPRRELACETVSLASLVRERLPALRAALPPGVELRTSVDGAEDLVFVDRKQIEHALLQLVLNARESMPNRGLVSIDVTIVEVRGRAHTRDGRFVRARVRDNGRGITPTLLGQVFEPFVTTKVPACGAGLGLTAVHVTAMRHDGFVEAESRPGEGAAFSIFLPVHGSSEAARAAPDTPEPRPVELVHAGPSTVLLVEDNAMVRRSIETTLRGMGYKVLAVESGEQCIELLKGSSESVDLLITDVVLPKIDGKELIKRVRVLKPALAVLYMSGYDRSTLASTKATGPIEHFLQKPFIAEELGHAVRSALLGARGALASASRDG